MRLGEMKFSILLYGLVQTLRVMARRHPAYARRLAERDFTAQIRTVDGAVARHYTFKAGRIASDRGLHRSPDITVSLESAEVGVKLFTPPVDHLQRIEAIKNFQLKADGPDDLVVWFMQTLGMIFTLGWEYGTDLGGGVTRSRRLNYLLDPRFQGMFDANPFYGQPDIPSPANPELRRDDEPSGPRL